MREELGDLLLQIVLHAQIAVEEGEFSMAEVLQGITRKLVRRHPHVFGEVEVDGVKDVLKNWEQIKGEERKEKGKGQTEEKGLLDGIPKEFPALAQAMELSERAARVGFEWESIRGVWDKIREELDEVRAAQTPEHQAEEIGDLLFVVVNLSRWLKVDAESALRGTNLKFRRRFMHIEKRAREMGKRLDEMTLAEMDALWNEAKLCER